MSRMLTLGVPLVGTLCGLVLVVDRSGGTSGAEAQGSVTCTLAAEARSSVAGSWALSGVCKGLMHLAGTDAALTGAWTCTAGTANSGPPPSGTVSGEFSGGHLRLNLTASLQGSFSNAPSNSVFLVDATLTAGGATATGTATGTTPAGSSAFSMTAQ